MAVVEIYCKYHLIFLILEARGILSTDKIERLNGRIERGLRELKNDDRELMCAASLAHHGLLKSLEELCLMDVDLSAVPAQHLASLASCVTSLYIQNVSGCDLVSILTSLKCQELTITSQSLGREETQALVQAMESGVKKVTLSDGVTLDMEALAEYSGQGVCRQVELVRGDAAARYREELRKWARSKNWKVDVDREKDYISFIIKCDK